LIKHRQRQTKTGALIAAFFIGSAYIITFLAPVSLFQNIPLCPLKFWTGIPCPLCGMTRAFASISHGDFIAAVGYHPLSPVFYLSGILLAFALCFDISLFRPANKGIGEESKLLPPSKPGLRILKKLTPVYIALFMSLLLIVVWIIRYNPFF